MAWLPLALTLSRIPMAALLWIAPGNPAWTLGLMLAAGASDGLDGFLARRLGAAGRSGAWLDPLCDKVFVLSALAAIAWAVRPPAWALAALAARELLQVPMGFWFGARGVHRDFDFRASLLGKLATVVQFAALGTLLFRRPEALPLCLAAGLAGSAAVLQYALRAVRRRT
jgi:cardiolipin synthase